MQWRHGTLLPPESVAVSQSIRPLRSKRRSRYAAFHQPLRQTEGLLRSIAEVLKVNIAIPVIQP